MAATAVFWLLTGLAAAFPLKTSIRIVENDPPGLVIVTVIVVAADPFESAHHDCEAPDPVCVTRALRVAQLFPAVSAIANVAAVAALAAKTTIRRPDAPGVTAAAIVVPLVN